MSQRTLHLLFPALLSAALVACGGGAPTPNPKPSPQPGNPVRARLVACPGHQPVVGPHRERVSGRNVQRQNASQRRVHTGH